MLKEYRHRCAICGRDHPHLHHIDENPSNNDPLNLIPLCPNCHLTGQHNPHVALDPRKLSLYRTHKHPFILRPQFHPLFVRLQFLDQARIRSIDALETAAKELVHLVQLHTMGQFYAAEIGALVRYRRTPGLTIIGNSASELERRQQIREDEESYREQLETNKYRVQELVVELLAYQTWEAPSGP